MLSVATAECFTHGRIGIILHKMAMGYEDVKGHPYYPIFNRHIYVVASMFLPQRDAIRDILGVELPPVDYPYRYAKVYDEKKDLQVAYLMAKGLKDKLRCNISIGTCAGVGRGGICILTDRNKYLFTTDVHGNVLTGENLNKRSENGISKTLDKLVEILRTEYKIEE
ncbi:MAG TPA: UPF0254 family protein [Methanothermococcus okinawensis]|uniref:UPF0254 protein EYH15_04925 n=1 Tax=Methanothermococcus okinawensis TaxID=155863 RepID=A0A833E0C2_9EURY|nr:UPF0254 family protein [Methanothermococcus okinawensis]